MRPPAPPSPAIPDRTRDIGRRACSGRPSFATSMARLRPALQTARFELLVDLRYQAREPILAQALRAGDEHILGIRGTQQPPAVGSGHAHPVGTVDLQIGRGEARLDL